VDRAGRRVDLIVDEVDRALVREVGLVGEGTKTGMLSALAFSGVDLPSRAMVAFRTRMSPRSSASKFT
jgi:hypothetical protein